MRALAYPTEALELARLVHLCHPTRKIRPVEAMFAYPHIVALSAGRTPDTKIIGYASFAVYPSPTGRRVMFGDDLGVHPDHRRRGLGYELFMERLRIAKEIGLNIFMGACAPDNEPMLALFESVGARVGMFIPGYYAEETPARDGQLFYLEM